MSALRNILLILPLAASLASAAEPQRVYFTGKSQPAAWVRAPKGEFRGRVFYTSLGLPEDFKEPNYRRLLINAIFWVADRAVPEPEKK